MAGISLAAGYEAGSGFRDDAQETVAESGAAVGADLRSARESRGISLERLCAETKVNLRYLEALERGDFQQLPGGVFRRGVVRAYLGSAGLAESEWLPRFDACYARYAELMGATPTAQDEAWAKFAANVKKNRGTKRQRDTARWLGVLGLFLILLLAAWAVWHFELKFRLVR